MRSAAVFSDNFQSLSRMTGSLTPGWPPQPANNWASLPHNRRTIPCEDDGGNQPRPLSERDMLYTKGSAVSMSLVSSLDSSVTRRGSCRPAIVQATRTALVSSCRRCSGACALALVILSQPSPHLSHQWLLFLGDRWTFSSCRYLHLLP